MKLKAALMATGILALIACMWFAEWKLFDYVGMKTGMIICGAMLVGVIWYGIFTSYLSFLKNRK